MKCDTKTTCHARAEVAVRGKVTLLICFEPVDAHPFLGNGDSIHLDRIVGVGFQVPA